MIDEKLKPSVLFGHGKRLIMVREQLGLKQIAEDPDMSFSYLSDMENRAKEKNNPCRDRR